MDLLKVNPSHKCDIEVGQVEDGSLLGDTEKHHDSLVVQSHQNYQVLLDSGDVLSYLSKICRFCLQEPQGNMRQLFANDIPQTIMSFTSVQIDPEDGLPSQICTACLIQLSRAQTMRSQFEMADAALREYIDRGYLTGTKIPMLDVSHFDNEYWDFVQPSDASPKTKAHIVVCDELKPLKRVHDDFLEVVTEGVSPGVIQETIAVERQQLSVITSKMQRNRRSVIKAEASKPDMINRERCKQRTPNMLESDKDEENHFENNEPARYSCSQCSKSCGDYLSLKRHERKHIVNKKCTCKICGKEFPGRFDLSCHIRQHTQLAEETNSFEYPCDECATGFTNERDLRIHSSVHSKDGKYVCFECSKSCKTIMQLKRHVRTHYDDKPKKCKVCGKGFAEMGSLTRHFRQHTGEQREKKYLCTTCGKKYYDSHSLAVHKRIHSGERPWTCKICGRGFIDMRLLNSHMKTHSEEKPYSCTMCNKSFTHMSTLTTHKRTHTGEKPYICSVCGKSFIQSSNLSLHMRVHSGEKPYTCTVCSRSFASSSTLATHKRIHTGEKPYTCTVCSKSFSRHYLLSHMRTHTGEKPHTCTYCQKRFTTTGQMSQHLRTHTGEKPYVCHICSKRCSSSTYLKKHIRSHGELSLPVIIEVVPPQLHLESARTEEAGVSLASLNVQMHSIETGSVIIDGTHCEDQMLLEITTETDPSRRLNDCKIEELHTADGGFEPDSVLAVNPYLIHEPSIIRIHQRVPDDTTLQSDIDLMRLQ